MRIFVVFPGEEALNDSGIIPNIDFQWFRRYTSSEPWELRPTLLNSIITIAFVHSHLLYGIEIYGNTRRAHLNKLMVLNNKLLRILQNAPRNTSVLYLHKKYDTLTIRDLHTFQILVLIHKFFYHQDKLPFIFTSYFNENFLFYSHDTRSRDNLRLTRCKTTYSSKSLRYKGSNVTNFPMT